MMRIGVAWVPCANANYRASAPVNAMARRGHEVVPPFDNEGALDPARLAACDVVHVFRRCDQESRRVAEALVAAGHPFVYDNDDDFTALPKDAPTYRKLGGLEGQRGFARTVKMACLASVFTTTNEVLAEKYRKAGVDRVEVIGNYLPLERLVPPRKHDGLVIGWVAGGEHQVDANHIRIADTLRALVAKHEHVRVECIGVNLALAERYRHDKKVDFAELQERISGFDIGIAPLVDIPLNRARSDVKLKEYAASGVPWLASPVGPYAGLGEEQGGRLVEADGWFEALDRLIGHGRERKRLASNAQAWARTQTIEAVADRWERIFALAAGASSPGALAGGATPPARLGSGLRVRIRRPAGRPR